MYIDRGQNMSKTIQRPKSKNSRFKRDSERHLKVTEVLKSNYKDIQRQAERLTHSWQPDAGEDLGVRYSNIPVNPGQPKEQIT